MHDGNFVELFQDWFEKELRGVGVIGDQHFEWGKDNLKQAKFYTAHHEPRFARKTTPQHNNNDDTEGLSVLAQEQLSYNKALYKLRARVELPFGEVKSIFAVLRKH